MLKLADIKPIIKESKKALLSSMEIVKEAVDGNTYAIVRENKRYFIKSAETKENLQESDFDYIGGIQNKTKKSFSSFSDATKHLNLMFEEINNHSDVDNINILESDLLGEKKYVLKLPKPKIEEVPETPSDEEFGTEEGGEEDFDFGTEEGGEEDFDFGTEGEGDFDFDAEGGEGEGDFDFDAEGEEEVSDEVEVNDELEGSSIKDIQSTTGTLGQQLRDTEDLSSDIQKWVAKSVLSALDLDNMDSKDKKDIINTVEAGGDSSDEVEVEKTEFDFDAELEESSDELGLNVTTTNEPDVQTWKTPQGSESGGLTEPWESEDKGYDEDNPDIGGDEDEEIAEPGKTGEDLLILDDDVINDDPYDLPNAEAEALYGPNTYPEYSRDPAYRAKKQADKDITTHYYKSAPPGFELDPSEDWRKHKLPYDTKFLDEDDDVWYSEMEDAGILAPSTYEDELGLPPATKDSDETEYDWSNADDKFVGEPIDSVGDFDEILDEEQIDEDMEFYDDIIMAPQPQRAPEEEPAQPQVDPGVPEKEPPSKRPSRQPFTPPPHITPGEEPGPKAKWDKRDRDMMYRDIDVEFE